MQKVQAVDETQASDRKCDVFLHVVGDAFYLFLQLRHRLHQVVRVVAPQVVKYNWYLVYLGIYSQLLIAFAVRGSAVPAHSTYNFPVILLPTGLFCLPVFLAFENPISALSVPCKNIFCGLGPNNCIFHCLLHRLLRCSKQAKNLRIRLLSDFCYKCGNQLLF